MRLAYTAVIKSIFFMISIGAVPLNGAQTQDGTGSIFLDNVRCVGTEARLSLCPANPVGSHNCVHGEDAGVTCQPG